MKNSILFFIAFSCSIMFSSCSNDLLKEGEDFSIEKEDLKVLKDFSKFITKEAYFNAYDKETGEVDYDNYEAIVLSYNFDKPIDLSTSFKQSAITRSPNNTIDVLMNNNKLTNKQKKIFEKILLENNPTLDYFLDIKNEVTLWEGDDKYLVVEALDCIIYCIEGLNEGLNEINYFEIMNTRSNKKPSKQDYACSAAVTMFSTSTSVLVGFLTAPTGAGPLIGAIVGGAIGTYFGAYC